MGDFTINQRFIQYCKFREIDQSQIKKDLGVKNKSQVSNWWNNVESIPTSQILKIIKKYTELNANWLINNYGEMLLSADSITAIAPTSPNYICNNPDCIKQVEYLKEKYTAALERENKLLKEKSEWLQKGGPPDLEKHEGGVENEAKTA